MQVFGELDLVRGGAETNWQHSTYSKTCTEILTTGYSCLLFILSCTSVVVLIVFGHVLGINMCSWCDNKAGLHGFT